MFFICFPEIRAAVSAQGLGQVSARALGVENGTERTTARAIPETLYTEQLRAIAEENRARGIETQFVTGYMELSGRDGKPFEARAGISDDGKTMWLQADNDFVTAEQLARHERYHLAQREDPGLNERVRRAILARYDEAALDELVESYIRDFRGTGLTRDEILEEIFADNYAGIDVFEYLTDYEGATRFGSVAAEQIAQGEAELQYLESVFDVLSRADTLMYARKREMKVERKN